MTNQTDPWAALADPTRRAVLARCASGSRSVAEIARGLPVSRPAVSQHLAVLKAAGLVRDRAVGTRRYYTVAPAAIARLRAELDQFWDAALEAFQHAVEEPDP